MDSKAEKKKPHNEAARKRWQDIVSKVVAEKSGLKSTNLDDDIIHQEAGLIEELKKSKQRSKVKESVFSVLKTQANLTEKVFERQKYSAKEMLIRKRAASSKGIPGFNAAGRLSRSATDIDIDETILEYNRRAEMRYRITPEIKEKLDKIKAKNDAAEEKRQAEEDAKPSIFHNLLAKLFITTIIGQTLKANPRFYKMDPHEHLPDLCRRCRRPLIDTLESRFTSIGILFCIFFPIIGILFLFANREFVCVICEEIYVYGDLTARPEEDYDDEDADEQPKT